MKNYGTALSYRRLKMEMMTGKRLEKIDQSRCCDSHL